MCKFGSTRPATKCTNYAVVAGVRELPCCHYTLLWTIWIKCRASMLLSRVGTLCPTWSSLAAVMGRVELSQLDPCLMFPGSSYPTAGALQTTCSFTRKHIHTFLHSWKYMHQKKKSGHIVYTHKLQRRMLVLEFLSILTKCFFCFACSDEWTNPRMSFTYCRTSWKFICFNYKKGLPCKVPACVCVL